MNILVIGSGGREHALVWKILQSPMVERVYCAPGNPGTSRGGQNVDIKADDLEGLLTFAKQNNIGLTVVGPEVPLVAGITDLFEQNGLLVFGPGKAAAQLEGSKAYSKYIMQKYGIPTAKGASFTEIDEAKDYIRAMGAPVVVKADGLAGGKGVMLCHSEEEACDVLDAMMNMGQFGAAGARVVIEEFLYGEEASFLAFCDGKNILPLPTSQDHKAVFDGDNGPNTGGMGAYSPAPVVDTLIERTVMNDVMRPIVDGMAKEGHPYKGVLYAGLMIDRDKVKVLEFNCRFGDPETQPLLMRVKSDIVPVLLGVARGDISGMTLDIDQRAAVCVIMASGGYPDKYETGFEIHGLRNAIDVPDSMVFHSGTAERDGKFYTAGGRVLSVTALGDTIEDAIKNAYRVTEDINWPYMHMRHDIGQKALLLLQRKPKAGIIMGSDSDLAVMEEAAKVLKQFGIPFSVTVASAHRTPEKAASFAENAYAEGMRVIIAGAGMAAHLAGVLAAHTTLPIIGVPIDSGPLQGMDALLSTVQMPPGVPVASMGIGKSGAKNAGLFAVQILAQNDPKLTQDFVKYKRDMAKSVEAKDAKLGDYR